MRRLRRSSDGGQEGFSLIEILVTLGLFSVLLAIFAAGVNVMFSDVRRSQGQSENLDASRKAVSLMDQQVRYANAVNTPGPGTLAGATYVEWRQGNSGQRQTCVQWRLTSDGKLAFRSWQPILNSGDVLGTKAWSVQATGISAPATGALFTVPTVAEAGGLSRQTLSVAFRSTHGKPPVVTGTQVTLTAVNTPGAAPLLTPVCQEVARS